MMDAAAFTQLVRALLAVAGAIVTLGGALAVIERVRNSSRSKKNEDRIKSLEDQATTTDARLQALERANRSQDKFVGAICETMLAMLDHEITGNSIDKLKKARDEMNEFLIHRGGG